MNHWERRAKADELENGVEISVAEYPGWVFRIRRDCAWNVDHARAIARVTSIPKYGKLLAISGRPFTAKEMDLDHEMTLIAFSEGIVAGWSGVTDRDGKPLKFTPANAREVLSKFPDIYSALRRESRNASRFTPQDEAGKADIAAGNSEAA